MAIKGKPKYDYTTIPILRDAFWQYSQFNYSNMGADYSITELLNAPRVVQLKHRYQEQINARPFNHDRIAKLKASFRGTAIHNEFKNNFYRFLQSHKDKGYLIERRIWDRINGRKISGQPDAWYNGALYDLKTCSVWKKIMADYKKWEEQLNLYAYLLATCNVDTSVIFVLAWYTDWNGESMVRNPDYPPDDIDLIHIPLWTPDKQHNFLYKRIDLMKKNEPLADEELDLCTPEEMWAKPTVWAVMKKGQSRALKAKGMDTKEIAQEFINNHKDRDVLYIDHRPGERTMCENFCDVTPWCNQYHQYKQEGV